MNTVGWVFVLMAALIVRGVSKGRTITDMPGDMTDLFTAFVTGDTKAVSAVLARKGEGQTPATSEVLAAESSIGTGDAAVGTSLLDEVKRLGAAGHYKWGGTGSGNGYDCSGLIWRAMKNTNTYTGLRFTTLTFAAMARNRVTPVYESRATVGDIVVWTDHMGIVDGKGTYYSALSVRSGIITTAISSHSGVPRFYRPLIKSVSSGFSGGLEGNPGKAADNVIPPSTSGSGAGSANSAERS